MKVSTTFGILMAVALVSMAFVGCTKSTEEIQTTGGNSAQDIASGADSIPAGAGSALPGSDIVPADIDPGLTDDFGSMEQDLDNLNW